MDWVGRGDAPGHRAGGRGELARVLSISLLTKAVTARAARLIGQVGNPFAGPRPGQALALATALPQRGNRPPPHLPPTRAPHRTLSEQGTQKGQGLALLCGWRKMNFGKILNCCRYRNFALPVNLISAMMTRIFHISHAKQSMLAYSTKAD